MTATFDIIIIGAGIAGASAAAHLAATHRTLLLDMEDRPGHHSTGRSAAAYEPNYGPPVIRALTRAARHFFFDPPPGFAAAPLVTPRPTVFVMPAGQDAAAEALMRGSHGLDEITPAEARAAYPPFRAGYVKRAFRDAGTSDIDVDLLHQGFLRLFRAHGGEIRCAAEVTRLDRRGSRWRIEAGGQTEEAPVIVNAAGAWADVVGARAGATAMRLQPKRRSVAVIPGPEGHDFMTWPLVGDVAETWYAKPQSGKLLVSPADATPVEPHDAYADDMTLAEGIARFEEATTLAVTRVERSWGGLRTFAPDGNPVVGYDPRADGFFWLAGQGGYGIQSSPALSRLAAALVRHEAPPADILAEGADPLLLSPARFANQPA